MDGKRLGMEAGSGLISSVSTIWLLGPQRTSAKEWRIDIDADRSNIMIE